MFLDRRRFLTVSAVALASLAGCAQAPEGGGTPDQTESPTPTPTQSESPTETPTSTPTKSGGTSGEITIKGSEWVLEPDQFTAEKGKQRTIAFKNVGSVAHNLTIGKFPANEHDIVYQEENETFLAQTETIQPDKTTSITITPKKAGEFPYWCDVSGHRQAGMVGKMIVK